MRTKLILLFAVVVLSVLSHYLMKHFIIKTGRENAVIQSKLHSERAINQDLTSEYNHLHAYSRIVFLAQNELDMILPANNPEKVHIVYNSRDRNRTVSRLVDFFNPSAEASSPSVRSVDSRRLSP